MKNKVLVLDGGLSTEKEVSKRSGHAVANALMRSGYIVQEFDFNGRLEKIVDQFKPDVIFVALHGKYGEDGTVQGMLELLGIPYTGSDVLTSAVCMDKLTTKRLFDALGVNTPPYITLNRNELPSFSSVKSILETDKVVIKPADQGSTIGISIVSSEESYERGIEKAFSLSNKVIAEKFISGTEITVSILGGGDTAKVLPIIEIVPENDFYDYESKYTPGMSHHIIPARVSRESYKKAEELSLLVYKEFGVRDFGRVDLIVSENGEVFVLEVNTIPGFTETSLLPDAANAAGINFETLVSMIVQFALSRLR